MSHIIFIGGATASGKTSLIKELESYNISRYKLKWALKEAGFRKNILAKDIGNNYNTLISTAKNILISEIFPTKDILIIDTHYAIQLNLNASLSKGNSYIENINEPYIAGIDNSILKELSKIAETVSFVFIQAPREDVLSRRLTRKENLNLIEA
ncbi:MAG: hypothetical protein ACRDAU_10005 [Clostridium sp.]